MDTMYLWLINLIIDPIMIIIVTILPTDRRASCSLHLPSHFPCVQGNTKGADHGRKGGRPYYDAFTYHIYMLMYICNFLSFLTDRKKDV